MVTPLASNVTSVPANPASVALDRLIAVPEPATQVTHMEQTLSGNTSTGANRANDSQLLQDPLGKALEQLNNNMNAWSTGMRFDIDPESRRVVVSIIDSKTGDVLRTVPSDAVIRAAKMIVQFQGKSINTKV